MLPYDLADDECFGTAQRVIAGKDVESVGWQIFATAHVGMYVERVERNAQKIGAHCVGIGCDGGVEVVLMHDFFEVIDHKTWNLFQQFGSQQGFHIDVFAC